MLKSSLPDRHLNTTDVAERFNISRSTLHRWRTDSDLGFPRPFRVHRRLYFREADIILWERRQGRVDEVERVDGCPVVSPIIQTYPDLQKALKERKRELGMTNSELELRAGLTDGHIAKLEAYPKGENSRGMGPDTFPLWLGGLRVGVVLVDLPRRAYKPRKKEASHV